MRLLKRHIGRPVDFETKIGTVNGRIENVQRGIATIRYWLSAPHRYEPDGYVTYVKSYRIKAIY